MRSRLRIQFIAFRIISCLGLLSLGACSLSSPEVPPRQIPLQQDWQLKPGSEIGGFQVIGSLGDISIDLNGSTVKAPFDGELQPTDGESCVAYTSPEVPAYLFRLCGVTRPRLGAVEAGQVIARSDVLQFAAMRRQPDGTWAIVEPATEILEKTLSQ
ncbi:MAG: hypothetical protein AAF609_01670 [Cyanobacteria bacterium P01_C01_bin.120]